MNEMTEPDNRDADDDAGADLTGELTGDLDADALDGDELTVEDSEDEIEELSLDQLSQAYAEVLRSQQESPATDTTALEAAADAADADPDDLEARQQALIDAAISHRSQFAKEIDPATEDERDNAPCPIGPDTVIEAILFVGTPPDVKLTSRKIASIMRDVSPKEINQRIKELNRRYERVNAPYRVVKESGNIQLKLIDDPELALVRQQFYGEVRHARLGQAAIEVLSVVAYHQPVTREEIEKIRGRPSGAMLKQLVRRQLLEFEVTETKPRKRIYRTTDRFLELFGLESMEDLPQTNPVADLEELAD